MERKKQRRKMKIWGLKYRLRFLDSCLAAIVLLNVVTFFLLNKVIKSIDLAGYGYAVIGAAISLLTATIILLLGFIILIHRSLSALPRIERIIQRVIDGEHSLRVRLRKKDIIYSFAEKLNKLLDKFESKSTK